MPPGLFAQARGALTDVVKVDGTIPNVASKRLAGSHRDDWFFVSPASGSVLAPPCWLSAFGDTGEVVATGAILLLDPSANVRRVDGCTSEWGRQGTSG